jgi:hypothetical protein
MYSGYLSVDVAGYIVSTPQSIVSVCRMAQNAHVRVTGTIFELLSTDDGSRHLLDASLAPSVCHEYWTVRT